MRASIRSTRRFSTSVRPPETAYKKPHLLRCGFWFVLLRNLSEQGKNIGKAGRSVGIERFAVQDALQKYESVRNRDFSVTVEVVSSSDLIGLRRTVRKSEQNTVFGGCGGDDERGASLDSYGIICDTVYGCRDRRFASGEINRPVGSAFAAI